MKKYWIISLLFCLFAFPRTTNAQGELAIGGETGFNLFARSGANFALPIGFNMERGLAKNLSLYGKLAFDVGLGRGDFNIFYISPEVRYNFNHVLEGPYIGGFIGFGPTSFSGFYIGFGATGGYKFAITEHLNLDVSAQFGYASAGNGFGRLSGIHFRPTCGLRYAF